MSDWVKIDIVSGCGGKCVYIDDHRVAGAKPLGGGYVEHTLNARKGEILKALKQPTEEEKSVHGEWIKIKDWDENDNALFECNNCHHADTHAKSVKVPYCWYCGAKMSYVDMRGVRND